MDPLSLFIGAGIALGGVLLGRALGRSDRRRVRELPVAHHRQPQAICGCGHHLVFHDTETKKCHAQVILPPRWTGQGGDVYRPCMCQGYRGPTPVDEFYAPDLLPDDPGPSTS